VLFVDGPLARSAPKARFTALPLLADRLAPRAIVVVDDVSRSDEHDMVQDWAARYPEFSVEKVQLEREAQYCAAVTPVGRRLSKRGPVGRIR
jgi:hypothetical protein